MVCVCAYIVNTILQDRNYCFSNFMYRFLFILKIRSCENGLNKCYIIDAFIWSFERSFEVTKGQIVKPRKQTVSGRVIQRDVILCTECKQPTLISCGQRSFEVFCCEKLVNTLSEERSRELKCKNLTSVAINNVHLKPRCNDYSVVLARFYAAFWFS